MSTAVDTAVDNVILLLQDLNNSEFESVRFGKGREFNIYEVNAMYRAWNKWNDLPDEIKGNGDFDIKALACGLSMNESEITKETVCNFAPFERFPYGIDITSFWLLVPILMYLLEKKSFTRKATIYVFRHLKTMLSHLRMITDPLSEYYTKRLRSFVSDFRALQSKYNGLSEEEYTQDQSFHSFGFSLPFVQRI